MRDYQRQKFYNFERMIIKRYLPTDLSDVLSFEESKDLINRMAQSYNIITPKVKMGRGRTAYYRYGNNTITLPPWAHRSNIVVHEFAHAVIGDSDGNHHGAFFVRKWCEIFSRMYSINCAELINEALKYGLDCKIISQ